jgi:hypothetical protein
MSRNVVELPLPPHGNLPPDGGMRCMFCHRPSQWATLSQYGARCFSCYESWQRAPQTSPDIGDKRKGLRDWAHALKRRHDAGERLTFGQIDAYRAALRREGGEDGLQEG